MKLRRSQSCGDRLQRGRDIVLANAAAALVVAGKVGTFLEGVAVAVVSIDSGAARSKVEGLARFTRDRA